MWSNFWWNFWPAARFQQKQTHLNYVMQKDLSNFFWQSKKLQGPVHQKNLCWETYLIPEHDRLCYVSSKILLCKQIFDVYSDY